jgi:hypothetical protein
MKVAGLGIRIAYAATAFLLSGAVVFFYAMRVLPEIARLYPELDPLGDGYLFFQIAICSSLAVAFSFLLYELTQPGARHRRRKGRRWRLAWAALAIVASSLAFAGMGWSWMLDLLFVAWLTYTVAYTFVRYGVLDDPERQPDPLKLYQPRAKDEAGRSRHTSG